MKNCFAETPFHVDPTPTRRRKTKRGFLSEKNAVTCFRFGDGYGKLVFSIKLPSEQVKKLWWDVKKFGPMDNGCFVSGDQVRFELDDYDINITARKK